MVHAITVSSTCWGELLEITVKLVGRNKWKSQFQLVWGEYLEVIVVTSLDEYLEVTAVTSLDEYLEVIFGMEPGL